MEQLRAHDGSIFPAIGFGTYALWGVEGSRAVSSALQNGYRLIDSAFNYENEGAVGQGIRESGVDRAEIIVTSKLPGRHHDYDEALRTIEESVYRLVIVVVPPRELARDNDFSAIHPRLTNPLTDRTLILIIERRIDQPVAVLQSGTHCAGTLDAPQSVGAEPHCWEG